MGEAVRFGEMASFMQVFVVLACSLALTFGWPVDQNDAELFEQTLKFVKEMELFKEALNSGRMEMRENVSLYGFIWDNCHKGSDIDVTDMKFPVDPIILPGTVQAGGAVSIKETIGNITEVVLDIHKNTWLGWVEIPCEKNIGSCTYKNICDLLERVKCPPELEKLGITCRCPLKGGNYEVPLQTIKLPPVPVPALLINGKYKVRATIKNGETILGCYEVQVTIQEK